MFGLSNYSHFRRATHSALCGCLPETRTHTIMHTNTHVIAIRGVLECSLFKKVSVQLAVSETAHYSAAPTVLMLLVGSADCTRHVHRKIFGGILIFY